MGGRGRPEELSNSASPRVPCQSRPPPVTCRGFNAFSLALGCAAVSKQVKFICHHNITRAIKTSSVQLLHRNRATPRVVEVVSRGVHGNGEDWDPMGAMGFPWEWELRRGSCHQQL